MDSPPLSEASNSAELQIPDNFNLAAALPEIPNGMITPPDSAPATPHTQSVHDPFAYNRPHSSDSASPSCSYYPESAAVDSSPVVLPSPMDFVSSDRTFWPLAFFRKEEVDGMNAQMVAPHAGVSVF